jgi:hypothetical protein
VAAKARLTTDAFYALPELEQAVQAELYEKDQHRHSCGNDYEVCGDPEKDWFPQRAVCYAQMEQAAADWRYDEEYGGRFHDGTFKKWSDTRSAETPFGHRDGVTIYVAETDLFPDDDWLPPLANKSDRPI